ncbi:MAG: HD domain-containing protein [Eubacteriales bacterium]|nr:HD domain-containing protein [Eubacteriales bacterium]
MNNLNTYQVMAILLKALNQIDERLVDHGCRVAYVVYKMMQADGSYQQKDMQEICIIAALHDIGAYKTEEIHRMIQFETQDVLDHSIYGYLFLKYMSPIGERAEVVLYHHMNYKMYPQINCKYLNVADMIHLADWMDVLFRLNKPWLIDETREMQDLQFGRSTVELFWKANEQYGIDKNIWNGSYLEELSAFIGTAEYGDEKLLEFIRMIVYSIDFRSEATVCHMVATASLSMELGKLFDLDEKELKKIQLGAYLHDIGKISTPVKILEKPGSLTPEEMQTMKKHVEITGDILKDYIHKDIFQIAYRHHEKIDGSGYPCRLCADQLTLSDRIVAVADQISALEGKRSYKEGFSKEAVIEILHNQNDAGKLCGRVTDSAIRHYDEIMEPCRKNKGMITEMYDSICDEFALIKEKLKAIS